MLLEALPAPAAIGFGVCLDFVGGGVVVIMPDMDGGDDDDDYDGNDGNDVALSDRQGVSMDVWLPR